MIDTDGTAVLDRIGLTPEQVRTALARHTPLAPAAEEIGPGKYRVTAVNEQIERSAVAAFLEV
jgi:hypothetical protein